MVIYQEDWNGNQESEQAKSESLLCSWDIQHCRWEILGIGSFGIFWTFLESLSESSPIGLVRVDLYTERLEDKNGIDDSKDNGWNITVGIFENFSPPPHTWSICNLKKYPVPLETIYYFMVEMLG